METYFTVLTLKWTHERRLYVQSSDEVDSLVCPPIWNALLSSDSPLVYTALLNLLTHVCCR